MTLAILCHRRHKVAIIAELNLKFSSRFLRQRNACGIEINNMDYNMETEQVANRSPFYMAEL